jgi:proteic killer suppression protein
MIKSFSNKKLENFFYDGTKEGINPKHVRKLERILDRLAQAEDVLKDMSYPGSCLHKLEPKKDERWAVKIDKNWRITFIFNEGDVYEVDYTDYHH